MARSQNGRAWEMTARGVEGWDIPEVATVPDSPSTVIAGTRGDRIWISEDFGESWVKPNRAKRGGPGKVRCVTVDEECPGRVYMTFDDVNFYLSENHGDSWEHLDLKLPSIENVKLTHA